MYAVYVAYDAVLLIPLGALIWFAVKRCNRVCQARRWPRVVAVAVGLGFLSLALLPLFKYGADWVGLWFILNAPFSVVLEFNASIGFWFYSLLTLAVAAVFSSTLAYVVAALVVRAAAQEPGKFHERQRMRDKPTADERRSTEPIWPKDRWTYKLTRNVLF